jgi:hypothetical protein
MKKFLFGLMLLFGLVTNAQEQPSTYVDHGGYRVLSEKEKTAECYVVGINVERLDIKSKVTINGQEYTVTSVADEAAMNYATKYLSSLTLPNTLKRIGKGNFTDCPFTELQLPPSLEYIGDESFRGLPITSIRIPASLIHLGKEVFWGCSIYSMIVEEGNSVYDSRGSCNAIIESANNKLVRGCFATKIPPTVRIIADKALSGVSITDIDIPASVEEIGKSAFYPNASLKSLTLHTSVPPIANEDVIHSDLYSKVTLYVPEGCVDAYKSAPIWGKFTNIVEVSNNDTSVCLPTKNTASTQSSECYDLQGRRLNGKPTKRVYIESGRKKIK